MEKIIEPSVCPFCGSPVRRILDGGANIYCMNDDCPEKKIARLNFFVSKDGMDIDGMSEKTIRKLMSAGLVNNWYDLYSLVYMDYLSCGFGEKLSLNLVQAVERSRKEASAEQVLCALGIPMVGPVTAGILMNEYGDIKNIAEASSIDLSIIDGIGDVAADYIASFFRNHKEELEYVYSYLRHEKGAGKITQVSDRLNGMVILATGTLKNFTREGIIESVQSNGGKYGSGVTKKLTFLLVGEDPGPAKISKAKQIGLKMINEDEYINIINGTNESE